MESSSTSPSRVGALWLSPTVHDWLGSSREPKVHSLFRQSCNLTNEREELITIAATSVGPGPFTLVIEGSDLDFEAELKSAPMIDIAGERLQVGELSLDLRPAELWDPKPDWAPASARQLSQLKQTLNRAGPRGSFAALLDEMSVDTRRVDALQRQAIEAARIPARELLGALDHGDEAAIRRSAKRLSGLGGGVTPSGDDFLMGIMLALWACGAETRLCAWIQNAASTRTNLISKAWLAAAARGEASLAWHRLCEAIAKDDWEALEQVGSRLVRRGHTSGADAMAGFIAAAERLGGCGGTL